MLKFETDYLQLISDCLGSGEFLPARNGNIFMLSGRQITIDLADGFPLLSGKKISPKHFLHELKWMLNGDTNIKYLNDNGSKIWDKWADKNGDLGPVYGKQFRNFRGVDQVANLIRGLKNEPFSRRHIISLWNPVELEWMALPPCFYSFQVIVKKGTVDLVVSQRSADVFIGLPYDVCFYSVFLNLIVNTINQEKCRHCNGNGRIEMLEHCPECYGEPKRPGRVIVNIGNAHVYAGHVAACTEYISRFPLPAREKNPTIVFDRHLGEYNGLLDYHPVDVTFENYDPLPFIPAEVYE